MLVVSPVFLSIVRVIMNIQGENLGKLTAKSIGILLRTTIIGIIIGKVFGLGAGMSVGKQTAEIREMKSIVETFRGLRPANPVQAMAEANIVDVVIFAGFIGIAIRRLSKKHSEVINVIKLRYG
ncbi:MAG: cation:dicarboxylase symporter family transporter [Cellulosilyticaceae bacterium]